MPELPEVETIRRGLEKKIVGLTVQKVTVFKDKSIYFHPQQIQNYKVFQVWRRAKILGLNLSNQKTIIFHLKMTGQLIYDDGQRRVIGGHPTIDMRDEMPNNSTAVVFEFDNHSKLYFNDQRRFGWVKIIPTGEKLTTILENLGPEPLDKKFTWEILKEYLLKRKKTPIKVALMDQKIIAGIGNIYASESLFLAGIDPRRMVGSLSDQELQKLHQGIIESLEISLKYGGSTRAHFVNTEGERGYYLDFANVYNREGELCKSCKGKVIRIIQGGRSTFFCPYCQQ